MFQIIYLEIDDAVSEGRKEGDTENAVSDASVVISVLLRKISVNFIPHVISYRFHT